jgi:clumping factor A
MSELRLRVSSAVGKAVGILAGLGALLLLAAPAAAQPQVKRRLQVEQNGDFVLLGNSLAYDCSAALAAGRIVVGSLGPCGNNTDDHSPDVFWRADPAANGPARADNTITAANARSTAVLVLPTGATVTHARLYWTAVQRVAPDTAVVLDRPGTGAFGPVTVTADGPVSTVTATTGSTHTFYMGSADVTTTVQQNLLPANAPSPFRVSGVDTSWPA